MLCSCGHGQNSHDNGRNCCHCSCQSYRPTREPVTVQSSNTTAVSMSQYLEHETKDRQSAGGFPHPILLVIGFVISAFVLFVGGNTLQTIGTALDNSGVSGMNTTSTISSTTSSMLNIIPVVAVLFVVIMVLALFSGGLTNYSSV